MIPKIFNFHYYLDRGYVCNQPGDNSGNYVNLSDFERLQDQDRLRNQVIQAAIHWHNADGQNLEFTETTAHLNIAVASYLPYVEDAPDKLLRYAEIIEILDREMAWTNDHADDAPNPEYLKGFLAGLLQAKHFVTSLTQLGEIDYNGPVGYMGDIGGTPYGPSDA